MRANSRRYTRKYAIDLLIFIVVCIFVRKLYDWAGMHYNVHIPEKDAGWALLSAIAVIYLTIRFVLWLVRSKGARYGKE